MFIDPKSVNVQPQLPNFKEVYFTPPKSIHQTIAESNYASEFAESLLEQINDFNDSLDNDHEVAVGFANYGQPVAFPVSGIGYMNPSLIIFYGKGENEKRHVLIQHVSQLSFLLSSTERVNEEKGKLKQKIGFIISNDEE